MSTKMRRLMVSLPPDVDKALTAMAKAEGRPQAKIVAEILVEFAPTMHNMAKLHAQIKAGQKLDAKATVQQMLGDQMANLLIENRDLFKA